MSKYETSSFTDVHPDSWYFAAVEWANQNGVVTGFDGEFDSTAMIAAKMIAILIQMMVK